MRVRHGDLVFVYGKVTRLQRDRSSLVAGVRTVEGSTGPEGKRDSTTGDGVWARERHFGELGARAGFVRLS